MLNNIFEFLLEWLFSSTSLRLFIPLVIIMSLEHFCLKLVYGETSSLERLLKPNNSAKTDIVAWGFYYILVRYLPKYIAFLAVPGVVYIFMYELVKHFDIEGAFGHWMPDNIILAVIIWLVVYDFPSFLSHYLMHKLPMLWRYHKYHHAAEQMNIITGIRISLAERYLTTTVHLTIAIALLGLEDPGIPSYVLLIRTFIDLLQHSNLPWGYGVFGYILASPRFHKIHHSKCHKDFDRNYGNIFAFWDFIFKTHNRRYELDRKVADSCLLGLPNKSEAALYNRPLLSFVRDTLAYGVFESTSNSLKTKIKKEN